MSVGRAAKRSNIVGQHFSDASVGRPANIPTLLASICWMAVLDARLNLATLFVGQHLLNQCWARG